MSDWSLTPAAKIMNSGVLCEGERILALGGASAFELEPSLELVDMKGCYCVPGMIDTHIHGAGGFDSSTAYDNEAAMGEMCMTLAEHGVTSFLPTIISGTPERMLRAVSTLSRLVDGTYDGAQPLGIHVEGPFLNKEKHGSQIEDDIRQVDLGEARELIEEGRGRIRIMTFAPELQNSFRLLELLLENNISPSMGHSIADEQTVRRAVDAGAHRCTHVFNGMPPLSHRTAGITAVVLTDDRITAEIILDGTHIHPRMVDLVCRAKPKDKIVGVSDAVQGTGLDDGSYRMGDTQIFVRDGRVTTRDGVLAGSTMMLERGWRHLVQFSHLKATEAAACMTLNPARSLGLDDRGELAPGKLADMVFFNSKDNSVRMVVVKGRIVYDSASRPKN